MVFIPRGTKVDSTRVNRNIRSPEVRVIDAEGKQLGVLPIQEALKNAEDAGLDLVEVSPTARPPVCRVMDYGKFKYQLSKKAHEAKKRQTVIHVKEIKLRTKTGEHDLQTKLRSVKKFLAHGDKVKVVIFFRGREIAHPEFGRAMLARIADEVKELSSIEQAVRFEGRSMTMILGPLHSKAK